MKTPSPQEASDFVRIPLTRGKFAIVDKCDAYLAEFKWFATTPTSGHFYASRNIRKENGKRTTVKMHKVILPAPPGFEVDHKNGDALDNRRANLRLATSAENNHNRRVFRNSKTGLKGVKFCWQCRNRPWHAHIRFRGERIAIGYFKSPEEAARAYDARARELFGEFARPNFSGKDR